MAKTALDQARHEVEELHQFFCDWYAGRLPESVFEERFASHFAANVTFISLSGVALGRDDLVGWIRQNYQSNNDFRIQIRDVTVHSAGEDHILVSYEEWQRNALGDEPSNNGRITTVFFTLEDGALKWTHIHENRLPQDVVAAEAFDF